MYKPLDRQSVLFIITVANGFYFFIMSPSTWVISVFSHSLAIVPSLSIKLFCSSLLRNIFSILDLNSFGVEILKIQHPPNRIIENNPVVIPVDSRKAFAASPLRSGGGILSLESNVFGTSGFFVKCLLVFKIVK